MFKEIDMVYSNMETLALWVRIFTLEKLPWMSLLIKSRYLRFSHSMHQYIDLIRIKYLYVVVEKMKWM